MRAIQLDKPNQRALQSPFFVGLLFDPVSRHRKVSIGIAGLPSIARQRYATSHVGALDNNVGQ